jgi:type VI secretion system Hcp family effector
MRFSNDGLTMWYGTADAPAPAGWVRAKGQSAQVSVTVGVQPPSSSNSVQITYRVNGGSPTSVTAVLLMHDVHQQAQYFQAKLPAFASGDKVDYLVICRSPGNQVPGAPEAGQFTACFQVIPSNVPEPPGAPICGSMLPGNPAATITPPGEVIADGAAHVGPRGPAPPSAFIGSQVGAIVQDAATPSVAYVSIKAVMQGQFKGEATTATRKDIWIPVVSFAMGLTVPHDAATGQSSGKSQYAPVTMTKNWGAASSQGLVACGENETLSEVIFEFTKTDGKGGEVVYQRVTLTNAAISQVQRNFKGNHGNKVGTPRSGHTAETPTQDQEEWSFIFQKIEVEDTEGGATSFTGSWTV